jgi:hypothetical protein
MTVLRSVGRLYSAALIDGLGRTPTSPTRDDMPGTPERGEAMAKASSSIAADRIAAYDRLIALVPGLDRKGATVPYTSTNGNMSSYLDATGSLALRLGPDDRERFLRQYDARLQEAYGTVQKEYVRVPVALLDDTAELGPWFRASDAWVSSLKPKPTKRR